MSASAAWADGFSGAWTVRASPDEMSASESQNTFEDGLLFRDGSLSSAAFAMLGFAPTEYKLCTEGMRETMTATFTSEDRGTLTYKIIRMTSGLTGRLIWTKPDGTSSSYTLDGERYVEDEPMQEIQDSDS
ncbi:MAG TPA: hypothetical protein PK402_03470 [Tepidisphaeraceae bacterium]|nr:hypothetical protein [Tepidisphaeraceae bacterium]